MNLDLLRTFAAVVEQGSLNRAAERLRVSQSTLTRQMQALEREVGGRLLERTASGVALTAVGRTLLEGMAPVLARFDTVLEESRRLARGQSDRLRVGYLSSAVSDFLNPALTGLRREHPEVKIRLEDLSPGEQIAALRKGSIDVGLVGHAGAFLSKEFYTRRLATVPVVVAMAENHRLAAKPSLRLADLSGEIFVGAHEQDMPGNNRWVMQLCRGAGFTPRFVENAESLVHLLATTVTEGAVALVPDYVIRTSVPGVVFRPLRDASARCDVYVAWQRGKVSAVMKAFLGLLPAPRPTG
jgi:DNA-binding transcriptional LysR family regulator